MSFRPLSALIATERAAAADLLRDDPVLTFYWATAIEDLARGIDNRLVRFSHDGKGIVIGAVFGDLAVFSFCGHVSDNDIAACAAHAGAVEIHAPLDEVQRYQRIAGTRLVLTREMVVMSASIQAQAQAQVQAGALAMPAGDCRTLGQDDAAAVAAFYRSHYPDTVFDPYMLFMPFVGAFIDGELSACAGTLVQSETMGAALIGHFATVPAARGRGLATALGGTLMGLLAEKGFTTLYLATTGENTAALRVYERLGFGTIDRRAQLDLMP